MPSTKICLQKSAHFEKSGAKIPLVMMVSVILNFLQQVIHFIYGISYTAFIVLYDSFITTVKIRFRTDPLVLDSRWFEVNVHRRIEAIKIFSDQEKFERYQKNSQK